MNWGWHYLLLQNAQVCMQAKHRNCLIFFLLIFRLCIWKTQNTAEHTGCLKVLKLNIYWKKKEEKIWGSFITCQFATCWSENLSICFVKQQCEKYCLEFTQKAVTRCQSHWARPLLWMKVLSDHKKDANNLFPQAYYWLLLVVMTLSLAFLCFPAMENLTTQSGVFNKFDMFLAVKSFLCVAVSLSWP